LAHEQAYLDRYAEPDKAGLGMETAEGWPVPYWLIDTAFATLLMLLTAVDAGLGALFFGIFQGERELLEHLGVPPGYRPIGAVALGYPADPDPLSLSLSRGRRSPAADPVPPPTGPPSGARRAPRSSRCPRSRASPTGSSPDRWGRWRQARRRSGPPGSRPPRLALPAKETVMSPESPRGRTRRRSRSAAASGGSRPSHRIPRPIHRGRRRPRVRRRRRWRTRSIPHAHRRASTPSTAGSRRSNRHLAGPRLPGDRRPVHPSRTRTRGDPARPPARSDGYRSRSSRPARRRRSARPPRCRSRARRAVRSWPRTRGPPR